MSKAKGARGELKTKRWLEAEGFVVMKSGASLGAFDLIAINAQGLRCVQVKATKVGSGASPKERSAMLAAPLPPNATREIWRWRDYAREPLIEVLSPPGPVFLSGL